MRGIVAPILVLFLSGCATIVNGSSRSVTVATDPPGASCMLSRGGQTVGAIPMTPGSVQITKSKSDLQIECRKDGYQVATVSRSPTFGGATFGNIIAGGVVGVVVDAASGANYTYPAETSLALSHLPAPPATAPAVLQAVAPIAPGGDRKPVKG